MTPNQRFAVVGGAGLLAILGFAYAFAKRAKAAEPEVTPEPSGGPAPSDDHEPSEECKTLIQQYNAYKADVEYVTNKLAQKEAQLGVALEGNMPFTAEQLQIDMQALQERLNNDYRQIDRVTAEIDQKCKNQLIEE